MKFRWFNLFDFLLEFANFSFQADSPSDDAKTLPVPAAAPVADDDKVAVSGSLR
jgi:hypothetical protein